MTKQYKPGQTVQVSGQYVAVGPRGGKSDVEITMVAGKTAPATPRPNMTYKLTDQTKHKGD